MADVLDFLNYSKMMDSTRELLTSDKWDASFEKFPEAVYSPGSQALKFRLKSVSGLGSNTFQIDQPLTTNIRGFEIPVQPGQAVLRNSSIQMTFLDYEDQSIYAFFTDWKAKCCNPVTQWSYRAEQLRANILFQRLNSQNVPVREYRMVNAMIAGDQYADEFTSERQLVGADAVIQLIGVVFPPTFLNTGSD